MRTAKIEIGQGDRVPEGNQNSATAYPWLELDAAGDTSQDEPRRDAERELLIAPVPRVCLSRIDAARALGIGVSTLKGLERSGLAPPFFDAPGGRRLFPVRALVEWAERRAALSASASSGEAGKENSLG